MLLTNISYHQLLSINPKKIINFVEKLKMLLTNFAFFFSVFSRLKMYFNYLTVCERLENPWITDHNFFNLRGRIIFLICKYSWKGYHTSVETFNHQ